MSFYRNRYMSSGDVPQIDNSRRGGVPGRDQYTKLLLHCDGILDSGAFIDSSLAPHPVMSMGVTSNLPPTIDSAQYKFNGFSGHIAAGSRYLYIPDHADWNFGTGDFTIETWIQFDALPTGANIMGIIGQNQDANNSHLSRLISRAGTPQAVTINAGGINYSVNDRLRIIAGNSDQYLIVTGVAGGAVNAVAFDSTSVGSAYSVANTISTSVAPAVGTGCKINITAITAHALATQIKDTSTTIVANYGAFAAVADTWYHWALIRYGTSWTQYVNGVQLFPSTVANVTYPNYNAPLMIGQNGTLSSPTQHLDGWIDEFRISKGVARWTANFTPPAMAYI
jgi:hypothetical protein